MTIVFRSKTGNNGLDNLNDLLYKNSKGRFELLKSTKGIYYMLDYDETGYNRVVRAYNELQDILECMGVYEKYLELRKCDLSE